MRYRKILNSFTLAFFLSMLCMITYAQGRQVQGIVKDKTGESMIGVNVLVKGTTNGTITGLDLMEISLCQE